MNNYNQRIRNELGPELKRRLRMPAFEWMMNKTRTISEWGEVNEKYFVGNSNSLLFSNNYYVIFIIVIFLICNQWIK